MKKLLLFFGIVLANVCLGQSITIDDSTPWTSCSGQTIPVNFTPSGGVTGPYTVQLIEYFSNQGGQYCGPYVNETIIKYTTTTNTNSANILIPNGLISETGGGPPTYCNYMRWYTIKVSNSSNVYANSSLAISSNCNSVMSPKMNPASICPGKAIDVKWVSYGVNAANIYTVELSGAYGNFSSPTALGTLSGSNADGIKTINVTVPTGLTYGNGYMIKVKTSDPVNEQTFGLTLKQASECGSIQYVVAVNNLCQGATSSVTYTLDDTFQAGNVFTAELSNEYGSFDNPITIGSISSQTANSIPITLPGNLLYNYSYRIRVLASLPSSGTPYISPNSGYFTIGIPNPQLQNSSYNFCENALFSVSAYTGSYQPEIGFTFNWKKDGNDVDNLNQNNPVNENNEYFQRLSGQNSDAGVYSLSVTRNSDGCSASSTYNTTAIYNAAPATPTTSTVTVLSGNTAVLTATGCTGTIYWYKTAIPSSNDFITTGTYTTPELTQNTTYYAECNNSTCHSLRTPLLVTVDASNAPAAPTVSSSDNNFCSSSIQNPKLTASGCTGTVRWYYKNLTNPQYYLLETDSEAPYEYQFDNYSSKYYAADCRVNGILSTTKAELLITVKPVPSPPSPSPSYQTINSGSDVMNNIYGTHCLNGTVKWYDASSDGNLLFTGRTYSQSNVTSSYNVYASCTENGCESSSRNSANVNIQTSGVAAPSFFTENETICGNGTATIIALGCTQGTVNWYTYSNSVNTLVGTGQMYTTPTLNYNPSSSYHEYYADCTIEGVTSSKNYKSIYVYEQPGTPSANQPSIACNTSTTLTATGCNTNSPDYFEVYWYASETASNYLSYNTSFTTPILFATTTYYVQCSDGYCKSQRVPITVTVGCTPPDAPEISSNLSVVCSGTGINLTATGCTNTVNWSDGGTGITRNNVIYNNSVTLTATCNNGLASANSNSLSITVNPRPSLIITNPASVSPPNTVDITQSSLTTGSTLNGASLSYHSDASGNVTLTSPPPNAINVSGTYYIKATTTAACTDIKPVVVVISDCGTAIVLQSTADDYNTGSTLKKTNETIVAKNKITGTANVVYRSNKSITLDPGTAQNSGFKADAGVVFKAEIGGCN